MTVSALDHDRDITIHSSLEMRAGRLAVRDAIPEDVDAYVKYWHGSGDRIIKFLRIDRARLGGPADSRERFLRMIRIPGAEQQSVIFTMTLNGEAIGYTNLNRYGPDDNYPHFHTYLHTHRPSVRSAIRPADQAPRRGAGVAAVLVGPILRMCFDLFPLRRIVLQTRPTSAGINRALDLYLPPAVTKYIEKADGLAGPGEFHMRYVYREDAAWMLERARALARGE
jgi:RimJ/RimL family protein N-acetyltransferase